MREGVEPRYFVEAVAKGLEVLESFDSHEDRMSISEVARRVGVPYSSAFRLLYTLERRGYVYRPPGTKKYARTPVRRHFRIGYAAVDNRFKFSADVTHSIALAARRVGVDLIVKDNEMDPQKALANAEILLEEKINLLIFFQLNETIAHLVAAKYHDAGVPVIAVNFAQPGAYYFGGNNFAAGKLAGEFMTHFIKTEWKGKLGKLVLVPGKGMGSTQDVRKTGMLAGMESVVKRMRKTDLLTTEPCITVQDGYREVKKVMQNIGRTRKNIAIMNMSDAPVIGGCRAAEQMGFADRVAIVGQGGSSDVRRCIQKGGPAKASVAYFPETYGDRLLAMALRIFAGEKVPLTVYTDHVILTRDNIRQYYGA